MEIWKDIEGYVGRYQVSNLGRIKGLELKKRWGKGWRLYPERILNTISKPYVTVTLSKNGVYKPFYVHRLVAKAFLPNPNNFPIIMHKDDNPENNDVSNLAWGTKFMNSQDMKNKGRARNQYTSNIK